MTLTLVIIIITVLVSISAFSNERIMNDLIFYPPAISHSRQWYRFFTCGFIHADFGHLLFNMYAFYLFGTQVEEAFTTIFSQMQGKVLYLVMYLSALFFCLVPTYVRNRDNPSYRSLGASGAVSAVVFAFILLYPLRKLSLLFLPVGLPGYIFGLLYLVISSVLDRRGGGNVNHSAHIWGALYGIIFLAAASYLLTDFNLLQSFIEKIQGSRLF